MYGIVVDHHPPILGVRYTTPTMIKSPQQKIKSINQKPKMKQLKGGLTTVWGHSVDWSVMLLVEKSFYSILMSSIACASLKLSNFLKINVPKICPKKSGLMEGRKRLLWCIPLPWVKKNATRTDKNKMPHCQGSDWNHGQKSQAKTAKNDFFQPVVGVKSFCHEFDCICAVCLAQFIAQDLWSCPSEKHASLTTDIQWHGVEASSAKNAPK